MYRSRDNLLEILLMFFVLVICDLTGTEKYMIVMALTVVFMFLGRKKEWSPHVLVCIALPAVVYLVIGCVCAIISGNMYITTIKTVVFWLLPLLFAFSCYLFKNIANIVDAQFIGSVLAYLVINARFLRYYLKVESMFSFAFGAFVLYYAYKKRWGFLVIAAYFLFVTDKRITMLAALVAFAVLLFLKLFRNDKRLVYMIWCVVIAFIYAYVGMICSGKFEYFSKGIGINTNGRTEMYTQLMAWFERPILFGGKGIGVVETLLEAWNIRTFANLHNDLLKFYVELGSIGLFVFLLSYGVVFYITERKFTEEKMCMLLAMNIYSFALFATDNVSIYVLYLIPYYSILFAVLSKTGEYEIKKKDKKCLKKFFKK